MFFASDNGGPVHPKVMAAVIRANEGHAMPYGACDWTAAAVALLREVFEAPEAQIFLVPTGTSANAMGLSVLTEPWRRTFCSDIAHIHVDEWGACAFYSGGGELGLVPQTHGKMAPSDLEARIAEEEDSGRWGPVSITQVTEVGTVHSLDELAGLTEMAARHDLPVHLDGARFANAAVSLGCTAAQMTEGVSVVSFGGTKNGCMGVEAIVVLDPERARTLHARRYRGGHLFSKHRYLAAQLVGYLEDGVWRDSAQAANTKAARLAQGLARNPDVALQHSVDANLMFVRMPRAIHDRLHEAGAQYYLFDPREGAAPDAPLLCRLVCDWSVSDDAIGSFLDLVADGA